MRLISQVSVALVLIASGQNIGTNIGGFVSEVDCARCTCDGGVSCAPKCNELRGSLSDTEKENIWTFYNLLVQIGTSCKVQAVTSQPIELKFGEFCVSQSDPRGFVVQEPALSNMGLKIDSLTVQGARNSIRIFQANAAAWQCLPSITYSTIQDNSIEMKLTSCPLSTLTGGRNAEISQDRVSQDVVVIILPNNIKWSEAGVIAGNKYSMTHSAITGTVGCAGEVQKVEWEVGLSGLYHGLSEVPRTTSPGTISGASDKFSVTMATAILLTYLISSF